MSGGFLPGILDARNHNFECSVDHGKLWAHGYDEGRADGERAATQRIVADIRRLATETTLANEAGRTLWSSETKAALLYAARHIRDATMSSTDNVLDALTHEVERQRVEEYEEWDFWAYCPCCKSDIGVYPNGVCPDEFDGPVTHFVFPEHTARYPAGSDFDYRRTHQAPICTDGSGLAVTPADVRWNEV